ncbi:MAG TPA: hypothetical protein VK716_00520 [Terracidiphilus sp.]|jgi:galactose mutarotase-like enzyme|nr:hypothetical protein [Terracidiphilus sp.]
MQGRGVAEAEKENVLIRAGDCSVTILPQFGGKIASIRVRNHELLQAPLAPIAPRTPNMPFDAADASGWDECLPSVAACTVPTAAGSADIPDHGDLWRVAWDSFDSNGAVSLKASCFSLPLTLERTFTLQESGSNWQLALHYKLTNTSAHAVPWSWAAHPLFAAEPGDSIELPASIRSLRLEGSAANRLGMGGDRMDWPIAKLPAGDTSDLSVAYQSESGYGDKLFAGPLAPDANWCALRRPGAGVRIRVSFDARATPYLGLWLCYGGWPDGPGPKQNCVALEPATAPVDSLALTGPWSRSLAPGKSCSWPMTVALESL